MWNIHLTITYYGTPKHELGVNLINIHNEN